MTKYSLIEKDSKVGARKKQKWTYSLTLAILASGCFAFVAQSQDSLDFNDPAIVSKLPSLPELNKQVREQPRNALLYAQRGVVHQNRREYPASIADFTKALQLKFAGPGIHNARAMSYGFTKNWNGVIIDTTVAISMEPKDANAYGNRGVAYAALNQLNPAMADLARAIQLNPKQANYFETIGEVCYKSRQYARGLQYLNRAIEIDPRNGETYYYRALIQQGLKKIPEAKRDWQQALALGYRPGAVVFRPDK